MIDGEDDPDEEDNEDANQENDEYAHSWGGSQYEPEEEEHEDEEHLEYLKVEDTPEGEGFKGPEEVRLSSMWTIQMFAMHTDAVHHTFLESTNEEPTSLSSILTTANSTRTEPPILDIEDIIPENHGSTSGNIPPQDDPNQKTGKKQPTRYL